jgi:DNA-binding NarL/FixJ family response regulator
MMPEISVALIDDHMLVRKGIRVLLEAAKDIVVVGEAADFDAALALVAESSPDVILLDLQIPGASGAELCWRLARHNPDSAVLILTAFLNPQLLRTCLSAGACGYLLKDAENLDIVSAVRTVASGNAVFDKRVSGLERELRGEGRPLFGSLTARELQVISLLGRGLTNAEISETLSITLNTTKGHIREIMRKMDCRNRVEIVTRLRESNLI